MLFFLSTVVDVNKEKVKRKPGRGRANVKGRGDTQEWNHQEMRKGGLIDQNSSLPNGRI